MKYISLSLILVGLVCFSFFGLVYASTNFDGSGFPVVLGKPNDDMIVVDSGRGVVKTDLVQYDDADWSLVSVDGGFILYVVAYDGVGDGSDFVWIVIIIMGVFFAFWFIWLICRDD